MRHDRPYSLVCLARLDGTPPGGLLERGARALSGFVLLVVLTAGGCAPSQVQPQQAGEGGQGANGGLAVATAIAAGTLWAAGGGCRLQGCPYGSYCNQKSTFCDVRKCGEGCPEGTVCNEGLGRCQAPPPASPPNDFLPQDNKANLPPGTR